MNPSNEPHEGPAVESASGADERQQKLAILSLFRLLETAVQTTEFKVGGQVAFAVQEVVSTVLAARSEFEAANNVEAASQQLRQGADAFRFKTVRWEAEARAARAGQRQLTEAQKRQLPGETAAVRSTARKTQIFFERLLSALEAWARSKKPAPEQDAGESDKKAEARPPQDPGRDGFTFIGGTETDEEGITLIFSLAPTKQFTVDAVDAREADTLALRFRNPSSAAAHLKVQLYNARAEPVLTRAEALELPATQEETAARHLFAAAANIHPTVQDTRVVTVELINVPEGVEVSQVAFQLAGKSE